MTPQRRQHYLKALDIDVWVLRPEPGSAPEPVVQAAPEIEPASASPSPREQPTGGARSAQGPGPRPSRPAPVAEPSGTPAQAPPAALPPLQPATDWTGLQAQVQGCQRCGLCETRTQTVFGVGAQDAPLMVIGEGPGADEDRQGEPFVGRAGQLLDRMLAAIGRDRRQNVYIANVVKCRPPGNRDPLEAEAEACRPYLEQQIKLLQPRLILALGRVAAQRLLKTSEPLARLRGESHVYGPDSTPVWVTYHPAYLLRSPHEKAKAWADLKRVRALLETTP